MATIDVVIYRAGDFWTARALNVEVSSFGSSPEEARASITEALELYFEDEELSDVTELHQPRLETIVV
ncbi:MAG: type II toxin-antitoxin system HicB family antitoxin [Tepidiformaceae bacterium]